MVKGPPALTHTAPATLSPRVRPIDPVLLLVACIWGVGNVVTKWVLGVLDPPAFLALRMVVVSILMAAVLLLGPRTRLALRDWLVVSVCGGGLMAAVLPASRSS